MTDANFMRRQPVTDLCNGARRTSRIDSYRISMLYTIDIKLATWR